MHRPTYNGEVAGNCRIFLKISIVIYGILGFIGGAIGALIYNLVAGMVGGIVFEVDVN